MNLNLDSILQLTSACRPVHLVRQRLLKEDASDEDFLDLARACGTKPCSAVLLSGGPSHPDDCNRYSVAGWDPFMTFTSKESSCKVRLLDQVHSFDENPLDVMDKLLAGFQPDFPLITPPFSGGALGYFAYDLKSSIETLPRTARDDLDLPDIFLLWPRKILVHDRLQGHLQLLTLELDGEDREQAPPTDEEEISFTGEEGSLSSNPLKVGELQSNFSHEAYLQAVRKVRHYIREGDVYQVNLSQRYRFSFEGDPFRLWESLFNMNPAPFYAFIHAEDHQVLSTSMERFLYRQGSKIETRPIKGTRKRGQSSEEDRALSRNLLQDPKDDAELSMIVDLLRNDLGRVCKPRSIRVAEHKRLESYQNVHHLVSIVTGILEPGATCGDLLRGTFPGGSITGCPKIRSMEIIDELEPNVRHVYTGAIGYLGWHESLDLNVAIRTAIISKGTCYFSVGGGIVHDSREEDEYQETLHKGRTLFQLIEKIGERKSTS